jgi:predicted PhzF superfamily epimerase YddE/YHI9
MVNTKLVAETAPISPTQSENDDGGEMHFFLPSGEEVSFCAHAALGGCLPVIYADSLRVSISSSLSSWNYSAPMTGDTFQVDVSSLNQQKRSGTACLHMTTNFEETSLSPSAVETLRRTFQEHLSIPTTNISNESRSNFTNASVARPKTLVRLTSADAVHDVHPLSVNSGTGDKSITTTFANACDAIDGSTGVYVYAPRPSDVDESLTTANTSDERGVTVRICDPVSELELLICIRVKV